MTDDAEKLRLEHWEPGQNGKGLLVSHKSGGPIVELWRTGESNSPLHLDAVAALGLEHDSIVAFFAVFEGEPIVYGDADFDGRPARGHC